MGTSTSVRTRLARVAAARLHERQAWIGRFLALAVMVTASGVLVQAAAAVREFHPIVAKVSLAAARPASAHAAPHMVVRWVGRDIDGDGAADFANPTGNAPRVHDAYGYGRFGASRDGGVRRHEGVDFMAVAGQAVAAPLSGYVTRIGYAYDDNLALRYIEITNPALRYAARVFYVDPSVDVGDSVRLGDEIGLAHTLQRTYPGGMTDHVHLEIMNPKGQRIDAAGVIGSRLEPVRG